LEARVIVGNVLIPVADLDEAIAFYGLPVKFRDGDRFAALNGGGVTVALAGPAEHVTASAAPSFKVDSVRQSVPELVARGAEVVREPEDGPHETRAVLRDPSGNVFVLYSPL
jgi:predicted enzyme related to lactoylglutathione lyase